MLWHGTLGHLFLKGLKAVPLCTLAPPTYDTSFSHVQLANAASKYVNTSDGSARAR
jgi:hypothetical protein